MATSRTGDSYTPFPRPLRSHPGIMLREAREAAGIDQRTLAEELYLTLHYVQAIEEGDFSRLPGATFLRGYLRSYARRLGIPESRVIESLEEYQRDQAEADGRRPRRGEGDGEEWGRWIWLSMALLLAGLVMMGLYSVLAPTDSEVELVSVAEEAEEAERTEENVPAPVVGRLTALPEAQIAAWKREEKARIPVAVSAPQDLPEPQVVEDQDAADALPVAVSPAPVVDRFEQRDSSLELHFKADTWVRVKDAAGKTLAFGVKPAGEVLRLSGESPYSIRIGNVAGTRLIFNGEEVDLSAHDRKNIANFVLN